MISRNGSRHFFSAPALFSASSRALLAGFSALLLAACGGGGGGGDGDDGSPLVPGSATSWQAGVFQPSANFAARCAAPRSGVNPNTGNAYADQAGAVLDENNWLRSWTHELYLWYSEVPDLNPANYSDTEAYFDLLKTSAPSASGNPKDRFHFTYPTAQWEALSQSGIQAGYGVYWAVLEQLPPRDIRIAYLDPAPSSANTAGLARGAKVIAIDGIDVIDGDQVDAINAALWPDATGESHTFTVMDQGATSSRAVVLTSADITSTPVQNVQTISTGSGLVGYVLFNDHIATAEQQLINAVTTLSNAGIVDLILDLRYNGGGYLDIASELAYMIAGPVAASGKTFERIQFNDQHPTTDPVTGESLTPVGFHAVAQGFSATAGQALPSLGLSRVFVLTGNNTCSASEAIINGLRGIGIEVIQIGSTTCGKPYGFYPEDNCGTTYFSIQFKGVNEQGFGDYSDGFTPANSGELAASVPGCSVADDFAHALGDANEARVDAALDYRVSGACPTPSGVIAPSVRAAARTAPSALVAPPSPWRTNRILRPQPR